MDRTIKIFKKSTQTFLQDSQYCAIGFLLLPVSISLLLSQTIEPSSVPLLTTIKYRLHALFDAAGFPPFSKFFFLLNLKLSQTITSSIFTLPFTLSFFLVAKATIIQAILYKKSLPRPSFSLYNRLFLTYFCNSILIFSTHAIGLCILFVLFNTFDAFGYNSEDTHFFLSAGGAVIYSIILAKTLITCNLALVVAGTENINGFLAILKAYVLISTRDSTAVALSLSLPVNLSLGFLEALFQYHVVRSYRLYDKFSYFKGFEVLLIAYLYSLFIVYETIMICIFYKNSKSSLQIEEQDESGYNRCRIEFMEEEAFLTNSRTSEEYP